MQKSGTAATAPARRRSSGSPSSRGGGSGSATPDEKSKVKHMTENAGAAAASHEGKEHQIEGTRKLDIKASKAVKDELDSILDELVFGDGLTASSSRHEPPGGGSSTFKMPVISTPPGTGLSFEESAAVDAKSHSAPSGGESDDDDVVDEEAVLETPNSEPNLCKSIKAEHPLRGKRARDDVDDEGKTLIDVLADRRLRKLRLVEPDLDSPDRLPAQRYLTRQEVEVRLKEKVAAAGTKRADFGAGSSSGSGKATAQLNSEASALSNSTSRMSWLDKARLKKLQRQAEVAVTPSATTDDSASTGSGASPSSEVLRSLSGAQRAMAPPSAAMGADQLFRLSVFPDARGCHKSRVTGLGFCRRDLDSLLLYSTGTDKSVQLYKVNAAGVSQPFQSTHVRKCPIWSSCFSADRTQLYCISDFSKIFVLDLETQALVRVPEIAGTSGCSFKKISAMGDSLCLLDDRGKIFHLDGRTYRVAKIFTSATSTKTFTFHQSQPRHVYAGDSEANIFCWDLVEGRCVSRTQVEGLLNINVMAAAQPDRLLVGDLSGCVAVNNLSELHTPVKLLTNLKQQAVSVLAAHPQKPVAVMASSNVQDLARLAYTQGTPKVCDRWPGAQPMMKRVTCAAFSEFNGWLAVGNDHGTIKLWRGTNL